MVYSNNKTVF